MGAYDGAEICELVGCLLLNTLNKCIDPSNHSLYRDGGLIIIDKYPHSENDVIRKKLIWIFKKFGFKLDIQINLKVTDYLDVNLDLRDATISPFKKNKQQPRYIDVDSNPTHLDMF